MAIILVLALVSAIVAVVLAAIGRSYWAAALSAAIALWMLAQVLGVLHL
jgi:hypothetical protein